MSTQVNEIPMEEKRTLFELVQVAASKYPHLTALVEESTLRSWNYSEMMKLVQCVTEKLLETIAKRVPNTTEGDDLNTPLVCILMDRSYLHIVAILAVLSIGAAYVPIDPSFPMDRQLHILTHSQCPVAIIESKLLPRMNEMTASEGIDTLPELLVLDDDMMMMQADSAAVSSVPSSFHANKLAYVLYTSGSTGKPKGVMVRDSSVCNIIRYFAHELQVQTTDHILGLTTFCFDISVLEIFMPLITGACLILASSATQKNPVAILKAIHEHRVTIMQATPTTYEMLLSVGWTGNMSIRCLVGGEACRPTVAALANKVQGLYNVYGPTETTIWSSSILLSSERAEEYRQGACAVPVGAPIWKTSFHLVINSSEGASEEYQEVLGEGEGELWIGGDGVALGYLHSPQLTTQRFVNNPFPGPYQHTTAYRTGDLFKRTAAGEYVFLRRLDDQVKVAGYRIELGEVERACGQHPFVIQAVAVVKDDRLAVFVKLHDTHHHHNQQLLREEVREVAAKTVPHYMLPSIIKVVSSFPTTANGKLDRLTLANSLLLDDGTSKSNDQLEATRASSSATSTAARAAAGDNNALAPQYNKQKKKHDTDSSISMTEFVISTAESISGQTISSTSASFAALGIDSLAAVLFRRLLSQSLHGFDIDVKLLYDPDTTVESFSTVLYDRLHKEQPTLLQQLHITSATDDQEHALQSMEEGQLATSIATIATVKVDESSGSVDIGRLMLQKRQLIDGLRGFVVLLIIADHFLAKTSKLGFRLTADTSYFVILTGFVTALQEESNAKSGSSSSNWRPLAFLHSRFVGLFPIYWLILFLCIPFIYVIAPSLDHASSLKEVLVLYILGLQEWTQYCNTLLREVYYVSLIWGVFLVYAAMKTTWILSRPLHLSIRMVFMLSWIVFLIGMQVYITESVNSGGMHSPWAMLYFALGFFAVKYVLLPQLGHYRHAIQRQEQQQLQEEDDQEHSSAKKSKLMLLKYLPGLTMDLCTFALLFTSFFNGYNRSFKYHSTDAQSSSSSSGSSGSSGDSSNTTDHDVLQGHSLAYTRFDQTMRLYGNPLIFTVILIAAFLQPSDGKTYPSPLTWLLSKTKIMPLLGECSLAIYLIQLVFMGFYYRLGIQGIQAGEYPYTRAFAATHNSHSQLEQHAFYLPVGIICVLILGVLIQKVYQDQFVARVHLRVMTYLRQWQQHKQKLSMKMMKKEEEKQEGKHQQGEGFEATEEKKQSGNEDDRDLLEMAQFV